MLKSKQRKKSCKTPKNVSRETFWRFAIKCISYVTITKRHRKIPMPFMISFINP